MKSNWTDGSLPPVPRKKYFMILMHKVNIVYLIEDRVQFLDNCSKYARSDWLPTAETSSWWGIPWPETGTYTNTSIKISPPNLEVFDISETAHFYFPEYICRCLIVIMAMFPVINSMRLWGKTTSRNREQWPVPIYLVNKHIDSPSRTLLIKHIDLYKIRDKNKFPENRNLEIY